MKRAWPREADAPWDAIILAGGRASRLGGVSKPHIVFQEMSLLDRALEAVAAAAHRVVVGDDTCGKADVVHVREFPRWGGPAAAIAAGLAALPRDAADVVVVLAADLPHVGRAFPAVTACVEAGGAWDGWIATDEQAVQQPLLAAYRHDALARRCAELEESRRLGGASLRLLLAGLRLRPIIVPDELCRDIDTPADARLFAVTLPFGQEAS